MQGPLSLPYTSRRTATLRRLLQRGRPPSDVHSIQNERARNGLIATNRPPTQVSVCFRTRAISLR